MNVEERISKLEEKMNLVNEYKIRFETIRDKHDDLCLLSQVIIGIQLIFIVILAIISFIIFPTIVIGAFVDFVISIVLISVLDSIKIGEYTDTKEKKKEEGQQCAKCKMIMEKVDDFNWYCKKDDLFYDESGDKWYRTKY